MITPERFWKKVDKSGDCWEWKASKNQYGYGNSTLMGERGKAHRHAWTLVKGPIPEGLHVLHRCDNPGCVNPDHLFLGTHADNMADKTKKGRGNQPKGERNSCAKLTERQVTEIRSLHQTSGLSQRQLAANFGVSQFTIFCIVNNKTWKPPTHKV